MNMRSLFMYLSHYQYMHAHPVMCSLTLRLAACRRGLGLLVRHTVTILAYSAGILSHLTASGLGINMFGALGLCIIGGLSLSSAGGTLVVLHTSLVLHIHMAVSA